MMLRRLHTYMAIVSAPIIVFFCLTGALQLFGWHEPRGAYQPPGWIEKLGMLHKKQRFTVRGGGGQRGFGGPPPAGEARRPDGGPGGVQDGRGDQERFRGPGDASGAARDQQPDGGGRHEPFSALRVLLLRWVFLLSTLSLVASTVMGAWIGLTHAKRKRLCWGLLALGAAVPVLLLAL